MLTRMPDRVLEILIVIVLILTGLMMLCYSAIFVNPQVPLNPFPPPLEPVEASIASKGPAVTTVPGAPTYPPTWTPTATPTPTNTGTVTPTRTPTPTNTATVTRTPTPTNTRPPPPPPKPTNTPTPYPYEWIEGASTRYGDCRFTRVVGDVLDIYGRPAPGIEVKIGSIDTGWSTTVTTMWSGEYYGRYGYQFCTGPCAGLWYVQILENGQPASMQYGFATTGTCEGDYAANVVEIDWRRVR
jgi:hypothetical protein